MEVIQPGYKFKGKCKMCGCVICAMPSEVKLDDWTGTNYASCPSCACGIGVYRVDPIDYTPAIDRAKTAADRDMVELRLKHEIFESHPDFCLKCLKVHAPKEGCK